MIAIETQRPFCQGRRLVQAAQPFINDCQLGQDGWGGILLFHGTPIELFGQNKMAKVAAMFARGGQCLGFMNGHPSGSFKALFGGDIIVTVPVPIPQIQQNARIGGGQPAGAFHYFDGFLKLASVPGFLCVLDHSGQGTLGNQRLSLQLHGGNRSIKVVVSDASGLSISELENRKVELTRSHLSEPCPPEALAPSRRVGEMNPERDRPDTGTSNLRLESPFMATRPGRLKLMLCLVTGRAEAAHACLKVCRCKRPGISNAAKNGANANNGPGPKSFQAKATKWERFKSAKH